MASALIRAPVEISPLGFPYPPPNFLVILPSTLPPSSAVAPLGPIVPVAVPAACVAALVLSPNYFEA